MSKPMLIAALTATALLAPVPAVSQMAAMKLQPATVPSNPIEGSFTFAAVGDLIYTRPILNAIEARSPEMLRILRSADATFGNLEETVLDLHGFAGSPQAESGGTWLIAPPQVIDDVKAMGFDLLATANNHATDWGVEGMTRTIELLSEAKIAHAGTGANLARARLPAYADTARGRVGLVAATSTFTPMSRAADPLGGVPGRPGVNAVRTKQVGLVTADDLAVLQRLSGVELPKPAKLGNLEFRAAEVAAGKIRIEYQPNERDVAGNALAVRQAKQNSNFVVFSLHNHEPGNESQTPADFAVPFAHEMIDAGADVFVGHGPHQLRGIEIYKGKPIFYSLGNLFMTNGYLDEAPADLYEQYEIDPKTTTLPEVLNARKEFAAAENYEAVIATNCFRDGKFVEARLYPVDLGSGSSGADRGVARMADPVTGQHILERLKRLSQPLGTNITIDHGVGIIRVGDASACSPPAPGLRVARRRRG
jgi:poly-gamma-glutamate synthesis protein (capsule biosynthesis protein)